MIESNPLEKTLLSDGDHQWMSQNYTNLVKIPKPNSKHAWFNCNYLKTKAILKYFNHFEEKALDSTIEVIQSQIDSWDHPNIVKVFDYDFNEKDAYSYRFAICQEKGLFSLRDELDKKNRVDVDASWEILRQIISALSYAQKNFNTYHGNIKPSNIICFNEEERVYKLSDFGSGSVELSKKNKLQAKAKDLTQDEYLAPEYKLISEKEEKEELDPFANDIYALGILALDMLGYKVEYLRGKSPESAEVEGFFFSAFDELQSSVSYVYYNMLQLMLSKNPNNRPSLDTLMNFFNDEAVPGQIDYYGDFGYGSASRGKSWMGTPSTELKRPKVKAGLKLSDYDKLFSIPIREFKSVVANKWMDQKSLRSFKQELFFDF